MGLLTLVGKRRRNTHSLAQLGAAAVASFPDIAELVAVAKDCSNWAVDFRYPAQGGRIKPSPEEDELRCALDLVDALARDFALPIPSRPNCR